MSRTHKDKPPRIIYDAYLKEPHERPLYKRAYDNTWKWLQSTPSWWTNLFMNRPLRREAQKWEREIQKINDLDELEDLDKPNVSKKPHIYYW